MSPIHRTTTLAALIVLAAAGFSAAQDHRYTTAVRAGSFSLLGAGRTKLFDAATLPVGASFDDQSTSIPLPFTFEYFGQPYNSVNVCTNGFVSFNSSSTAYLNQPIPTATAPNAMIAAWWDDLRVANNGFGTIDEVSYEVQGLAPFRTMAIEWRSVSHITDSYSPDHHYLNFQVRLLETGFFYVAYGLSGINGAPVGGLSGTIGIEDQTGTHGHAIYDGNPGLTLGEFPEVGTELVYIDLGPTTYDVRHTSAAYVGLPAGRTILFAGSMATADDAFADIPVGFPLEIFGIPTGTLRVSTNGYITVPPASGTVFDNVGLPGAGPNPMIAPWWDDLRVENFGTPDEISYYLDTTGPADRLTVQWLSVSVFGDAAANHHFLNFQVSFTEGSNVIEFNYGNSGTTGAPGTPPSATVGVESATIGQEIWTDAPALALANFPALGTRIVLTPAANLLCGDCNQDQQVSILDALRGAQHAAGINLLAGAGFAACNVTGALGAGGTVDILDALNIAQNAAGIIPSLSCMP